ncbi:LytR/AlgR family response regulator transcription factor [Olleya sp. R77988]|uniref:LytR/AlgR family response regulator transcription factor n=1 Tax=Olleya sp. R77988 TaxID=3093875 RepID=UPI0037CB13EF
MKKLFLILITQFVVAQQIPIDSISYEYFYGKELQQIVVLKQKQANQPFNLKTRLKIAELYQDINCEDSAYATYYKLYEYEKNNNRTLNKEAYKELLFNLHTVESSKHNYERDRRVFLNELKQLTKEDNSDKWQAKIENEIFKDYFSDSLKTEEARNQIEIIKETDYYKNNDVFRSIILLNEGNLNTYIDNYQEAENNLLSGLELATKNKDILRQTYCLINLGANENKRKNYNKALYYFNQIDKIPNNRFKLKIERILASNRGNSYYYLKDSVNLKFQDNLYAKLDSVINDFRKNSNFYEVDIAYQTKEKDKKIAELSSFKESFNKNRIVYSILLFLVFLLALYSFIRWKKSDKKKRLLDIENEKTKTELETVKSLVINDHIVLKNKSKVYLNELIYVKSDGHYLNLFTTAKKEFVRGKISEIEQQLPPNFIKCHRSYIVNRNCIKQYSSTEVFMTNGDNIPLSRGFKF